MQKVVTIPHTTTILKENYSLGKEIKTDAKKIIIPWCMNDECAYFLKSVFEQKKTPYLGHFKTNDMTYIKLLMPITAQECELYAKNYEIHGTKRDYKDVDDMLSFMQTNHHETLYSLYNSIQELQKKKVI